MPNIYDQFDAAPAVPQPPGGQFGVTINPTTGRPLLQASPAANVYDQFDNATPGVVPPPGKAAPAAPSVYQSTYGNVIEGAEQHTVPQTERYGAPIATGSDVFYNDAGEIQFRDKSGNLVPTDASKHVVFTVPEGKAVYARTPETEESPGVGAARVLSFGLGSSVPATGAAAVTGPARVFGVPLSRPAGAIEATVPKLKEAATAVYNDSAILNRPVSPVMVGTAFGQIAPELRRFDPEALAPVFAKLKELRSPSGLTIKDLDIASTRLGEIADETKMTAAGPKPTATAKAATIVKKKVDEVMRQLAPEFISADSNYSAAMAAETIAGRAGKAQVLSRGGDFAGRMQTQATQLLANPRYLRGFTPSEVEQLKQISEGTLSGDTLRQISSRLGGKISGALVGGFAGATSGGLLGAVIGAPLGAAIEGVVGKIVTSLGNRIGANQVNRLSNAIRARSPLGQEIAQRTAEWKAAFDEMKSAPTQARLSTLATASRSLSTSLGSAGVKVRPAELLRASDSSDQEQVHSPIPGR